MTAETGIVVLGLSRWYRHYEASAKAQEGDSLLRDNVLAESTAVLTRQVRQHCHRTRGGDGGANDAFR